MTPQFPTNLLQLDASLRSVVHDRFDRGFVGGHAELGEWESQPLTRRQAHWLDRLGELEGFLQIERRWPHSNSRRLGKGREEVLANWVRYQRKREDNLSDLQCRRLEAIPGFSWAPLEDIWNAKCQSYSDFLQCAGRLPSKRAAADDERQLAIWRSTQRRLDNEGHLLAHRIAALRRVELHMSD